MIRAVVEQHAEEVASLWTLRDAAVLAPHYDLPSLIELDERLSAHLDALKIAGRGGISVCRRALELGEAGEVFALAVLSFGGGDRAGVEDALFAAASPELARGLASALGWLPLGRAESAIRDLCAASDPALRRAGIAGSLAHRRDPGPALYAALEEADTRVRARALRAAGELGRRDLLEPLREDLRADREDRRFWAAWSAAILGDTADAEAAVAALKAACERGGPHAERACAAAVRRMDGRDATAWIRALADRPGLERAAVIGAGARGDPADVPWLLDQIATPSLARIAGDAIAMITGAPIQDLRADPPDDFEGGPTDDPDDEDVQMDPDEPLPWPSAARLRRFWKERGDAFQRGTRYLLGQPITPGSALSVLRRGTQRQRAAAALELSMLRPGQALFEVRAPGFRQARAPLLEPPEGAAPAES